MSGWRRRPNAPPPDPDLAEPPAPAPHPVLTVRNGAPGGVWHAPEEKRQPPPVSEEVTVEVREHRHPLLDDEGEWSRASQPRGNLHFEYAATGPLDADEEQFAEQQLVLRAELWNRLLPIETRRREALETLLYSGLRHEIAVVQAAIRKLYADRKQAKMPAAKALFNTSIGEAEQKRWQLFQEAAHLSTRRLAETAPLWSEIQRTSWSEVRQAVRGTVAKGLCPEVSDDALIGYRVMRQQAAINHAELKAQSGAAASRFVVRWPDSLPVENIFGNHDDRFSLERNCARIRIGTNWLRIPICLDRKLPRGGRLRQAYALLTPASPRPRWTVVLTINAPHMEERQT
jgi:hypothetical protein